MSIMLVFLNYKRKTIKTQSTLHLFFSQYNCNHSCNHLALSGSCGGWNLTLGKRRGVEVWPQVEHKIIYLVYVSWYIADLSVVAHIIVYVDCSLSEFYRWSWLSKFSCSYRTTTVVNAVVLWNETNTIIYYVSVCLLKFSSARPTLTW